MHNAYLPNGGLGRSSGPKRSAILSHTIGAEIPYRRPGVRTRTGSLVFDRHLDRTIADARTSERLKQD